MYRRRASKSALAGVPSGPYTGGTRTIDVARLPRAMRVRIADVLAYRAEPTPLVHVRPGLGASPFRPAWGLVLGIVALAALTALRLGDPRSAWAILPAPFGVAFVLAALLVTSSLLILVRRRARVGGASLTPGRWLLPLDVVEVTAPDASGAQRVVVTPLGDARDAEVKGRELLILFDERAPLGFPLRTETDGVVALRRLEHTQRLLEDVTYGDHLEKALAHDPFFEVRVDDSWAELAAPADLPRGERLLFGRFGAVAAALIALAVGAGGFAARNRLSDRVLFVRAMRAGTVEAYDDYLARGVAYRELAGALRSDARLEAARVAEAEETKALRGRRLPDRVVAEACKDALRVRGAKAHPEVTQAVSDMLARSVESGEARVPVRVTRHVASGAPGARAMALREREDGTIASFERVFSESCPASVLAFARGEAREGGPTLDLAYTVAAREPSWLLEPNPGAVDPLATERPTRVAIKPLEVTFDVTLRGVRSEVVSSFRLSMPPPSAPTMALRDRSLFLLEGPAPDPGTFDERAYAVMTARAFDRLYDELFGLFFEGDPRVPLRGGDEQQSAL